MMTTAKLHIIHSLTTLLSNLHNYLQALLTAAGRNVATIGAPTWLKMTTTGAQRRNFQTSTDASSKDASLSSNVTTTGAQRASPMDASPSSPSGRSVATIGTQRGIDATTSAQRDHFQTSTDASSMDASPYGSRGATTGAQHASPMDASPSGRNVATYLLSYFQLGV